MSLFVAGLILGFILGMIVTGWSIERADNEGLNPDTGYEPTGSHWEESRATREEG